ncbi:hypothetical protein F4821DRAFT_216933 [Hypoxylon rubiginosum]|uniref:Uncharacterized protein n=1 Tax=Hypoxylon rubiginosum TaxID=110542 RepID=A0ACC0CPM3_9PEZI|nr:hypothetical protein F4821DRAFT_216933 [Hypoxylon rubiginosum]
MSLNKCAVCWKGDSKLCVGCKSCAYCSKECQRSDFKSHKLLCKAIAEQEARPTPSHVRAIFFPEDKPKPQLVWIRYTPEDVPIDPGLLDRSTRQRLLMRNADDTLDLTKISWNHRLKQEAPSMIEFHFRDNFYNDGSQVTASIMTAVEPHGPEKRYWRGPLLVLAISIEKKSESDTIQNGANLQYTDATLADFRSVIDHSLCYERQRMPPDMQAMMAKFGFKGLDLGDGVPPPASYYEQRKGNKGNALATTATEVGATPSTHSNARETILGVQLNCQEKGSSVRQVKVDRSHPIRNGQGEVSPISRLVGMPLRLRKNAEKFADWGNQRACWMMVSVNIDDPSWGFAPLDWQLDINNVVVVRDDGQDLTLKDVSNMHGFCADYLDKVQDAAEEGTRAAKMAAMTFLTPQNYQAKIATYNYGRN